MFWPCVSKQKGGKPYAAQSSKDWNQKRSATTKVTPPKELLYRKPPRSIPGETTNQASVTMISQLNRCLHNTRPQALSLVNLIGVV